MSGLVDSGRDSGRGNIDANDPLQKSESAFHGISLLYLFPHQADDTHLAIATEDGGPSRVGHSIAFYLHVSNDRGASPHFVPRQVDMMFDFFPIERIRSTISAHRAVQVSALLI